MEREERDLEEKSERVEEHIRQAREDWKQKEEDSSVPGAQPEESEEPPEADD